MLCPRSSAATQIATLAHTALVIRPIMNGLPLFMPITNVPSIFLFRGVTPVGPGVLAIVVAHISITPVTVPRSTCVFVFVVGQLSTPVTTCMPVSCPVSAVITPAMIILMSAKLLIITHLLLLLLILLAACRRTWRPKAGQGSRAGMWLLLLDAAFSMALEGSGAVAAAAAVAVTPTTTSTAAALQARHEAGVHCLQIATSSMLGASIVQPIHHLLAHRTQQTPSHRACCSSPGYDML